EIDSGLTVADLFQHVISPVQHEIGRLWQQNRITVIQEHYCTAAIESLITQLRRTVLRRERDVTAVSLCPGNEDNCLALTMYTDLLRADGWKVIYSGARSPVRE